MPAESLAAPIAAAALEIDLAHHAAADQVAPLRFHHFADELMAGNAGKAVIAALQFEIGIADAAAQQANERETLGHTRPGNALDLHAPVVQMHR